MKCCCKQPCENLDACSCEGHGCLKPESPIEIAFIFKDDALKANQRVYVSLPNLPLDLDTLQAKVCKAYTSVSLCTRQSESVWSYYFELLIADTGATWQCMFDDDGGIHFHADFVAIDPSKPLAAINLLLTGHA